MYAAGHGTEQMRAPRAGGYLSRARRGAALLALLAGASVGFAAIVHGGAPHAQTAVVVQPGDTLWSIAASHYPSDDVRARVDDIEQANGLSSPAIEVGQTLRLP